MMCENEYKSIKVVAICAAIIMANISACSAIMEYSEAKYRNKQPAQIEENINTNEKTGNSD